MLTSLEYNEVSMLPGLFKERMDINKAYLMELGTQELLQNYYIEAGIIMPGLQTLEDPSAAKLHWGWEAPLCQLRGHFLGHFISACATYACHQNDMELKAKMDFIIHELRRCQIENGGQWVGPIPEKYFTRLIKDQYIWSPQYTMHKLIMGLTHAYLYTGNSEALEILDHLAEWYLDWTRKAMETNPNAIYSGEESGMLEIWSLLYANTKDPRYLELSERYCNPDLFENLAAGKDALTNCHSNSGIPWSHGAARMYLTTGDEKWKNLAEAFFKCAVTDRGTYCTGGQNAGEFWTPPMLLGQFMSDRNQEFCTVYNMVRLASYLYSFTGKSIYADYIEKNLYNGFLAQQNPTTGMPTYFLPMRAGGRKKWGTKRHDFWCCHGTTVQAHILYPELIWHKDCENDRIVVSQYIPSTAKTKLKNSLISIEQTTGMKTYNEAALFDATDEGQMSRWLLKFKVTADAPSSFTLSFRIPGWIKRNPEVTINGVPLSSEEIERFTKDGFLNIKRQWNNDTVMLYLPEGLSLESLPDRPDLKAILEGPVVLAGITDRDCGLTGDLENPESILVPQIEHTYETFPWRQSHYITKGQSQNFAFKPLYEVDEEAYTLYFSVNS